MAKILIVDDEPTLVATLGFNCEREGYDVWTAGNGEEALRNAREVKPDLVILDLMLGDLHGFEVCRILRKESSVPILVLTAVGDEVDKVVALELGADDYVTKPFNMRELMARVRALMRRSQDSRGPASEVLASADLAVDVSRREVTRSDTVIDLKAKEFDLLVYFLRNRGITLTREQLLQAVWRYDGFGQTRTVDVHVARLREKIEDHLGSQIVTVRGVGYRFNG